MTVEKFEKEIMVSEYAEKFVNIPKFLSCCESCPNFGEIYSCPPYEFNPEAYLKSFSEL